MVDPIGTRSTSPIAPAASPTSPSAGGFNAALAAQQKADADKAAHAAEIKSIRDKGFSNWVRDTYAENLRKKMREQAMASMGVTDDDLAKMPPAMRAQIEKRIEDAIKEAMDKAAKEDKDGKSKSAAAKDKDAQQAQGPGQNQPGGNNRAGKVCPVIPILAWPGGPSILG
jgi:hypothetical protein